MKKFNELKDMKPIGITRKFDELGRVTIPIEYRRELGLREGDAVDVQGYEEGIFLKPVKKEYRPSKKEEFLQ